MSLMAGYRFDAFNALCRAAARRKGAPLDLVDIGRAHKLTLALGEPEPDRGKVEELARALELLPEDLHALQVGETEAKKGIRP